MPGGKEESFKLPAKATLEFSPGDPEERCFDVGCPAFLYHKGKFLQQGEILLFEDANDTQGRALDAQETLTLRRNLQTDIVQASRGDEEVYVQFEIGTESDNGAQEKGTEPPPPDPSPRDTLDPLDL